MLTKKPTKVVAVSFGVLVGPVGVGLIDVTHWQYKQDFTQQFSRIVIALQVHFTLTYALNCWCHTLLTFFSKYR